MSNPSTVIRFDKISGKLERPTLLLKTRTGSTIGEIQYTNLQISFVGKGLDEISFDVHKTVNGKEWEHWDKLIDLCIIDYKNYGQFEADVSINDENESIKTVCCKSLETELGQQIIREGHYNDEQDVLYSEAYSPTVLYNEKDTKHSLLHRIIKDKAPHWSIGEVSKCFNINGKVYNPDKLQRTFTVDGISIYDFLNGDVSEEFSCIFTFDTYNRAINCYNLEECVFDTRTCKVIDGYYCINGIFYDPDHEEVTEDNELFGHLGHCDGIGEDTSIFLTKAKLSQSFNIDSNKDAIKNCFYVTGGDDVITNYIGAANVTGSNYIYLFSNFQYEDMGTELAKKIRNYSNLVQEQNEAFTALGGVYILDNSCSYLPKTDTCVDGNGTILVDAIHDGTRVYVLDPLAYYENDTAYDRDGAVLKTDDFIYKDSAGLFTKYCHLTDRIYYLEHSKFPDTSITDTTAVDELNALKAYFAANSVMIKTWCKSEAFAHVTGNIKSLLKVVCDSRYTVEILSDSAHPLSCSTVNDSNTTGTWSGYIRLTSETDGTDTVTSEQPVSITIQLAMSTAENVEYCKQKMDIAIAAMDISELDFSKLDDTELEDLLRKYNVTSLKSFYEGFDSCLATLTDLYNKSDLEENDVNADDSSKIIRSDYIRRYEIAKVVYDEYLSDLNLLKSERERLDQEIAEFREQFDIQTYLGEDLYKQFRCYVREDEYNNSNYVSDGLNDSEILEKCKELITVANRELSTACSIQKVINGSLNNIFALKELEQLHSKFALFNYVRVKTDDRIYKLRLMDIRFSDESPESISVTFSDQIISADGRTDDIKSILEQSQSIATSYSSTVKQSQQGVQALNTFDLMQKEGLDSSLYLVKNSNTEEVTIDKNGINCKSMLDDGIYSANQCRMNANGLYLTLNAWSTVSTALGRFKYNGQWVYGLNAGVILGELVVTREMHVRNSSSSVLLDENGIAIEGGYLHISNGNYSVEIDPTHAGSNTNKNYIFSINHGTSTIMGVTNNGDGYFSGEIHATSGSFTGSIESGSTITCGNNFFVDDNGVLKCSNADITGKITATSGSFSGNITSTATISGGTISGGTISGGSISIGSNFSVDTAGNMIATNATLTGTINANLIKAKNSYYICDTDSFNTYVKVISSTPDNTSDTKYNFGRLSSNGYNSGLNYLSFVDNSQDRSCHIYSDLFTIHCSSYIKGDLDISGGDIFGFYAGLNSAYYIALSSDNYFRTYEYNSTGTHSAVSNVCSLGSPNYRWAQLYISASSVSTSDRKLKKNIQPLDDKYIQFFTKLIPCSFQFRDGKSGRTHIGFISQDVEAAMQECGLSALDFAGFCKDKRQICREDNNGNEYYEDMLDENGNIQYIYSLRYEEFIALNTYAIQKLFSNFNNQQQEIDSLKDAISSLKK